jgi:hypothetical protein
MILKRNHIRAEHVREGRRKPKESFFVKCGLHETHKKRSDLRMIVFNFPFECFTIV